MKNLLGEAGIEANRVHTVGLGFENDFYIDDQKEDGTLDESVAPHNRSTKITSLDSSTAKRILSQQK